jgi:molybdenum storage protein
MSDPVRGDGARNALPSSLGQAPMTGAHIANLEYDPVAMDPDVRVLKIGGQSVMDRGRTALFPLLEEIVALKDRYKLLLGTGGGTRARHVYSIGADLELPTGILAATGAFVPMQNARMLQMLLARHGGIYISHDDFEKLPLYHRLGCIPIMMGMPPFRYWEKPAENSRIPANRTDAGVYLSAEVLGARRVLLVKDEEGLYEDDPKKRPGTPLLRRVGARDLLARDLPDLIVERVVLDYLTRARFCTEVQIINGLVPGNLTRALAGEDIGTIIYKD